MSGSRLWRKGVVFALIVLMLFVAAAMLIPAAGAQEYNPHYIYEPSSTSLSVIAGDPGGASFDLTVGLSFTPSAGWWVDTQMVVVVPEDPFSFVFDQSFFTLNQATQSQVVHVTVTAPEGTTDGSRTIKAKMVDGSGSPSVGEGAGCTVSITVLEAPTPTPTPPPSCPSPHLTAAITDISTSAPQVGEQFTVTAQVTNTGAGDATDVTATLGCSLASIVAGANPQPLGNLASGQSAIANWTLRCDAKGRTVITVDPEGIDACSLLPIPESNTDEASNAITQCFIATAAYGTSTAAEIDTLRAFRDEVLLESALGSQLVEWYYQTSPPVADFISENSLLRTIVRELVVDPIASLVKATEAIWGD